MAANKNQITLGELAALVDGQVIGDPKLIITAAGPLDDAAPGSLALVDHADRLQRGIDSPASALVVPTKLNVTGKSAIAVADVHAAFRLLVAHFRPAVAAIPSGKHPLATIDPSATIADSAHIHAGAIIAAGVTIGERTIIHSGTVIMAGATIGCDTTLFPNVTVYDGTVIGDRCLLHAGAVMGAYGFGYSQVEGQHVLAAQLGGVELGDDVEIGAGTAVDRGVYGPTRIGNGTKIDNLVQIGHNCQIGRHNLICSQVGIAGSTTTGDYVVMAGQAGVRDHVTIGDGAQLGAMSGVSNDVAPGANVLGAPAVPEREQKLRFAAIAKLPEMRKEFKQFRRIMKEMQAEIDALIPSEDGQADDCKTDRAA